MKVLLSVKNKIIGMKKVVKMATINGRMVGSTKSPVARMDV